MAASLLFASSDSQRRFGLAVLRIVTGIVFAAHGYQKVFMMGLGGTTAGFEKMGVFMPGVMGPLVALLELFGGLALIIGLLTRLVALGLAFDMLGAMLLVHFAGGFFLPAGYEFTFMLCGACIALVLGGAGALSVDEAIAARRPGPLGTRASR